jgi:hypothetical protein
LNRRPAVYKTAALPAELLRRYLMVRLWLLSGFGTAPSSTATGCRSARGGVAPHRPDRDSGRASISRRRARRPGGRRRFRRLRSRARRFRAAPPTPREPSPPDRRRSGAPLRERSTRSGRCAGPPRGHPRRLSHSTGTVCESAQRRFDLREWNEPEMASRACVVCIGDS